MNGIPRARSLVPVLVFAVGFSAFHAGELASRWDLVAGTRGDARFVTFLLEHWFSVLNGNASVLSPPMFHPLRETLGSSHALIGYVPLYAPWRWLGWDPWSASQIMFALIDVFNFAAALWLLERVLQAHRALALFFAAIITFNSVKLNATPHLQLQSLYLLLVAAGLTVRAVQGSRRLTVLQQWGMLSLAALCFDLQLLTDVYNAWFAAFWSLVLVALMLCQRRNRVWIGERLPALVRPVSGALLVGAIGLVPFVRIHLPVKQIAGYWPFEAVRQLLPRWQEMASMGRGNLLWGATPFERAFPSTGEHAFGIGLAWFALVLFLLLRWQRLPAASRAVLAATVLVLAAGMGYGDTIVPWRLIYAVVPGAASLRVIGRMMVVLVVPIAAGTAIALSRRWPQWNASQRRATVLWLSVIALEQLGTTRHFSKSAERLYLARLTPQLGAACRAFYIAPQRGVVGTAREFQVDAVWLAELSGMPTLNGYTGRLPPGWRLYEVAADDYESRVAEWVAVNRITDRVCRVEASSAP